MQWFIPAWYCGPLSKTPYAAFNRWRFWPGVLFCCAYLPLVTLLIALNFVPPERLAVGMLWIRDRVGPQSPFVRQLLAFLAVMTPTMGPAYLLLAIATVGFKRQWSRFRRKCLNCGETRLSEFLDDCSKCGSQFKDQDQYRAIAKARKLRRAPAVVRRPGAELRTFRRSAYFVTIISACFFVGTCLWGHVFENSAKPPRPATGACLVLSSLSLLASLFMFSVESFRRTRANLLRLKGCCLMCEEPLESDEITCHHCGSSVVAQQLWVRRILLQNSGFARPQVVNFAKELGIPTQL